MFKKLWEKIKVFTMHLTKGFACGGIIEGYKLPPFKPHAYVSHEPVLSGGKQFWVVKEMMDRGMVCPEMIIKPSINVVGYYEDKEAAEAAAKKRTTYLDERFKSMIDDMPTGGEDDVK